MTTVTFNQGVVGIRFAYEPNVIYDLPDDEAQQYIRAGFASTVGPETASLGASPERAVKPRGRARRRDKAKIVHRALAK